MINKKFFFQYIIILVVINACKADAQEYLGTKTTYKPQQTVYTKPPAGYKPFFINYVGRHGARFLTSAGSDVLLKNILQQAGKADALTKAGNAVYTMLDKFLIAVNNNYGNTTKLGEQEQQAIAQRMQQNFQEVFTTGDVKLEMTEKLRTQQSAHAFLLGLKDVDTSKAEQIIFPAVTDSILRFYDLSKAYDAYVESDAVRLHIDTLMHDKRTMQSAMDVCMKIFKPVFIDQLNKGVEVNAGKKNETVTPIVFMQALYDVYSVLFAAKQEMGVTDAAIQSTFKNVFSATDLYWLDQINSAEDFYEKGPAENNNGIQVTIASPLLRDLIETTNNNIQHKNYDGIFRFTHAEAISPLAALMNIPQASHTTNTVYAFSKQWQAEKIIPLSANIQWIIYSNGKDYLLKVLLNEKEVKLPLSTSTYPYYKWDEVSDYYLKKVR